VVFIPTHSFQYQQLPPPPNQQIAHPSSATGNFPGHHLHRTHRILITSSRFRYFSDIGMRPNYSQKHPFCTSSFSHSFLNSTSYNVRDLSPAIPALPASPSRGDGEEGTAICRRTSRNKLSQQYEAGEEGRRCVKAAFCGEETIPPYTCRDHEL